MMNVKPYDTMNSEFYSSYDQEEILFPVFGD